MENLFFGIHSAHGEGQFVLEMDKDSNRIDKYDLKEEEIRTENEKNTDKITIKKTEK